MSPKISNTEPPPEIEVVEEIWGRKRIAFLITSAVALALVVWWASEIMLPFVLAIIIAYVLTPLVELCERRGIARSVSILIVYFTTAASLYTAIALIAPRLYQETAQLTRESPLIARRLAVHWGPLIEDRVAKLIGRTADVAAPPTNGSGGERSDAEPKKAHGALEVVPMKDGSLSVRFAAGVDVIQDNAKVWHIRQHDETPPTFQVSRLLSDGVDETVEYLKGNALELLRVGQAIVRRLTRGVFLTFMTLMVAGYLMHTRDDIGSFFRSLWPPSSRRSFDRLMHRMDRGLSGVVRGQLMICAVNGVLSAIGFALFGLKYWPILALIAGALSIIPIFGSILSTVPAVLIGLTQDAWTALWVLIWILAIHQIEANLLNPKIIGVAARLHPVLVVFVLIAGEHFFGLWGALLAVPTLSIAQSLFVHFRLETMPDVKPDSVALTTPPPPGS